MIQSGDGDWIINSHPSGIDSDAFMAIRLQKIHVLIRKRAFYLAASHRQIKESLLCVLGASAVKFLFWTKVKIAFESFGKLDIPSGQLNKDPILF